MQQISFSDLAYTYKKKTARKERFPAKGGCNASDGYCGAAGP